jgi:Flp pilus assembly protein TadB
VKELYIIIVLFYLTVFIAIYLSFLEIFKVPTKRINKTFLAVSKKGKKKEKILEILIIELSEKLGVFIKLGRYKKKKLKSSLKSVGLNITPEIFIAKALVKAGLILLSAILMFFIFPIIAPVNIIIAILVFFKEIRSVDEFLKKSREEIENELPRFVNTLSASLKSTRDVVSILEIYKESTKGSFKRELEITTGDMKTGNIELALTRFETRINSSMLSDVIRGLIGVIRGDDNLLYFEMLSHDFKELEIQRLKAEVMKRPSKIKRYSMMLLGCFILTYLSIMFMQIVSNMGNLF